MADEPATVVTRVRRDDDTLHIRLDDLAADDGPVAEVEVQLVGRHAGTIVEPFRCPTDPLLAGRLLDAATDELRAIGRRRLVATLVPGDPRTAALVTAGFRELRRDGARVHLGLEL